MLHIISIIRGLLFAYFDSLSRYHNYFKPKYIISYESRTYAIAKYVICVACIGLMILLVCLSLVIGNETFMIFIIAYTIYNIRFFISWHTDALYNLRLRFNRKYHHLSQDEVDSLIFNYKKNN